jgi:hypothetical protein
LADHDLLNNTSAAVFPPFAVPTARTQVTHGPNLHQLSSQKDLDASAPDALATAISETMTAVSQ